MGDDQNNCAADDERDLKAHGKSEQEAAEENSGVHDEDDKDEKD